MQNTRTNELMPGDSLDDLRERIPETDRGPTFEDGEVIRIKGYYYRVVEIQPNRITFAPHGPRRDMRPQEEREYKPRRGGQR